MSAEQHTCKEHFTHTSTTAGSSSYFNQDETHSSGTSRPSTERRSHAVERRLERDPDLKFHYNFMKHEEIDHMEPVTSQQGSIHVTIHHTIQTQKKQVPQQNYSCSMEVLKLNELSSNDILQVRATVQQDL